MSRTHVTVLLALSVLAFSSSAALAQVIQQAPGAAGGPDMSRAGRATATDVDLCQGAAGGSRMRANCDRETPPPSVQQVPKVPTAASLQPSGPLCEATTLTEYIQRNTVARVNGTVSIKNCPTGSTGTYNVVVRVKDASGEVKPLEFNEKWQSSDAADVKFTSDYPIGGDVELMSVRVRNLKCTCADSAQEPAQTSTATDN